MKPTHLLMVPIVLAGLAPYLGHSQSNKDAPVLVELFTSQGCSSCPPAEKLLSTWGMEQFHQGKIIPLAFHVDYWDHLGWKDPYSSASYSQRQRQYAQAFRSSSVYTPQMVVSGRAEFVGSDGSRAQKESMNAAERGPLFSLALSGSKTDDRLDLSIELKPLMPSKNFGHAKVYAVLFENGLINDVATGENEGRTLRENFVVRKFQEIRSEGMSPLEKMKTVIFLDASWDLKNCGVVVFVQEPKTMEVLGVNVVYPLLPERGTDAKK
jgi:hypothetical protein